MIKPNSPQRILVVDDEPQIRELIASVLRNEGYAVDTADDGDPACRMLSAEEYDLVFTDLRMPRGSGLDVLRHIRKNGLPTLGVVVTGYGTFESAIDALRMGAFDYLTKPLRLEEIRQLTAKALEAKKTKASYIPMNGAISARAGSARKLIGKSEKMQALNALIATVANTSSTVLIRGESGTGKELVARALHAQSPRRDRALIPVNCGAIPEELLESELFGHVKGSFTGAMNDRIGRFMLADGGTIFLDEIGDMSPKLQVKLLRALQEQEIEPVGSAETVRVDVRILAATNVDLERSVEEKRFREDLYYRLNVIPITVPPLREHLEDLDILVEHFLAAFNGRQARRIERFSPEAMDILRGYHWPGNVRELENLVERMTILAREAVVRPEDLPEKVLASSSGRRIYPTSGTHAEKEIHMEERAILFGDHPGNGAAAVQGVGGDFEGIDLAVPEFGDADTQNLNELIDRFERDMILKALQQSNGVKNRAAQMLGIKRTTLVEKMKKKNISLKRA